MTRDYLHLANDTAFPGASNIDVYAIRNEFDYSRWGVGTQVKLCNVLYNGDYADVVKFDDDTARDAYFDALAGRVVLLQTAFQQVPRDAVKIPIPADAAQRYNYLYLDLPMSTSDAQPIDYESQDRVKRYYYFVTDVEQVSPNTSKVSIALDIWTTYINDVDIPYMMLERGHAPVTTCDADTFLADPVSNSDMLLAPDVSFGEIGFTQHADWIPIGSGVKWVCFSTTYSKAQLEGVSFGADADATSAAVYSDETGRAGYKMGVTGYDFGSGGVDFSNVENPVQAFNVGYGADVPSLFTFAIRAVDARSFFDWLSRRATHVLESVEACFMLADDVAMFYDPFEIEGFELCKVAGKQTEHAIELRKSDFAYPEIWERYAKLYTYPYAAIEISDNNGATFTVRVEDTCATSALVTSLNVSYPYLSLQSYMRDVAGFGSCEFAWRRIDDDTSYTSVPVCDFAQLMCEWDIPVYALYERGYDAHRLHNWHQMQLARENAVAMYESSQRIANVTDANTHDTNATNTANTRNSTSTMVSNVDMANDTTSDNFATQVLTSQRLRNAGNDFMYSTYEADVDLTNDTVETNNDLLRTQTANAQVQNGFNAAAGAVSAAMSGNVLGAAMNAGSGIVGAATTASNTAAALQANSTVASAQNYASYVKMDASRTYASDQVSYNNGLSGTVAQNAIDLAEAQAAANKTTTDTNASNTAATSNANADYTRNAQQAANAAQMTIAQRDQTYGYRSHLADPQTKACEFSGDPTLDARDRRGLSVRVKTQRKSDLAQAAAQFARYGYAVNQVWDMSSGFNLMNHFTYWKAADLWVNDSKGTPNAVQYTLAEILKSGVTVWKEPEIIGKVSLYDN